MKLVSCHVEGFGAISKTDFGFSDGLSCILQNNGTGKTTLASFIKAMFYGLPSVRTGGSFNERQHYCPMDGGKFGGNLVFSFNGKVYQIVRFFDKKSETKDETAVYCGGKLTNALTDDIGKKVFGVDEQTFKRTVFITSDIVESGDGGDISKMLSKDAGATDPADLQSALASLDKVRKELKADRGKKGLLYDKREERLALSCAVEQLKEREAGLGGKYADRQRLADEISALERTKDSLNDNKVISVKRNIYAGYEAELAQKMQDLSTVKSKYPSGMPEHAELDGLERAVGDILKYSAVAENERNNGRHKSPALYFVIIALAVLAVGAGVCFLNIYAGLAVAVAGFIILIAGIIASLKSKSGKSVSENDLKRIEAEKYITDIFNRYNLPQTQDISGAIRVMRSDRLTAEGLERDCKSLRERNDKFLAENNINADTAVDNDIDGVDSELSEKRRRLGILDSQIAGEEAELELLPDNISKLEALDEELKKLGEKHETLVAVTAFLKQADENIKDRYVAPVRDGFVRYSSVIDAVLGDKMTMGADFSVSFEKCGSPMGERYLSAGQRSICSLCLRLALIDNMYTDEKPFIIADDPFVNLDGDNFDGCERVMKALSKQFQIIYFTCHESRRIR